MKKFKHPPWFHGRPINDDIKKFNYELIRLLKTVLFLHFRRRQPSSTRHSLENSLRSILVTGDNRQGAILLLSLGFAHVRDTRNVAPIGLSQGTGRKQETYKKGTASHSCPIMHCLQLHFVENWNELHHLLIMEELLGSELKWFDRFLAEHIAIVYGWTIFALYLLNPTWAYNLNQVVEEEAYQSYTCFLELTGEVLRAKPAPQTAQDYYSASDGFNLQDLPLAKSMKHLARKQTRPKCKTLYDTFALIRQDELEHAATMSFLQQE